MQIFYKYYIRLRGVFHKDLSALRVLLKSQVARGLWRVIALDRSRAAAAHWM